MNAARGNIWPSLRITARILEILRDSGSLTKTELSQKSGINYSRLRRHLDWLEEKGVVEMKVRRHKIIVDLTKTGKEFTSVMLRNNNK